MRARYEDVPDSVYPSFNVFGIPELNLSRCATGLNLPLHRWGRLKLSRVETARTIHFYTDDYKFSSLWAYPGTLLKTRATTVIEPNFSLSMHAPYAVALWRTYQKRWLSRYWQQNGLDVIVDLNVPECHSETNLHGVPYGWSAYASRGYNGNGPSELDYQFDLAVNRAETDDILFFVYGGGLNVKRHCIERGWVWVAEDAHIHSRYRPRDVIGWEKINVEQRVKPLNVKNLR